MTTTAVSRVQQHQDTLKSLFYKAQPTIEQLIPRHMSGDRLLKIALIATSRTPLLMQCTAKSILQAVINAAQLGLECNSPLGHAYLVPFRNAKQDVYEATLIPGYRGYVDLAHRSGKVAGIFANPVFADDEFDYEEGMEPKIHHRPKGSQRSVDKLIACYSVGVMKSGFRQPKVMFREELDQYRARSRARDTGPWKSDPIQMFQKTPVRQLIKFLPLSPEMAALAELDNRADVGEPTTASDILDFDFETATFPEPVELPTGTEKLRNRLQGGKPPEATDQGDGQQDGRTAEDDEDDKKLAGERQPGED